MAGSFSIRKAYSDAFQLMRNHLALILGSIIFLIAFKSLIASEVVIAIMGYSSWEEIAQKPQLVGVVLVLEFVEVLLYAFFVAGFFKMCFELANTGKSSFKRLFSGGDVYLAYLMAVILYSLTCLGGFILLVIPGIYWGMKYGFNDLCVIDQGSNPLESFKASGKLTQNDIMKLFLFNVIGMIMLILSVGLLNPVFQLARVTAYKQLKG